MKKTLLSILVIALVANSFAKSNYIPQYSSLIALEDNGTVVSDSSITNELFIAPADQRFSLAILHDTITKERIKSIRRQEVAYGLATTAAFLGVTAGVTSIMLTPLSPHSALWHTIHYVNGVAIAGTASYLAIASNKLLDSLHKLPVTILFTNNSDQEMCINDMNRGLFWYVRPHCELTMNVGNPEINSFRIAYADCNAPQVSYATIQGANMLEDAIVIFENEHYWVYEFTAPQNKETPAGLYVIKDKHTMQRQLVQGKECQTFIKNQKK